MIRRTRIRTCALFCAAAAVFVLPTRLAHASVEDENEVDQGRGALLNLAADVDGAAVIETPHTLAGNSLGGGTGFKARVGAQFHVPMFRFTPELGYGYTHFFATNGVGPVDDWNTNRLFGGVRLGLGELIVPSIYGHAGYGWRHTADPSVPDASGATFDAGIALDLHLLPFFGFGAHAEYVYVDSRPYVPQWLGLGLQANLAF
jgi:hypothetical protein